MHLCIVLCFRGISVYCFASLLASACSDTFGTTLSNFWNYFVWLRITHEGSVPGVCIWSIVLIQSDLKWCIHLSRSLFLYLHESKSYILSPASTPYFCIIVLIRGLSGKFEDRVITETKTSNNIDLFLFVLLRTISQFIYEFSFQSVKFLNKILNIFMQWGVGHRALR